MRHHRRGDGGSRREGLGRRRGGLGELQNVIESTSTEKVKPRRHATKMCVSIVYYEQIRVKVVTHERACTYAN